VLEWRGLWLLGVLGGRVIGVKRSSNVWNPILNDLATARQAKDLVGFIAPWRFESFTAEARSHEEL